MNKAKIAAGSALLTSALLLGSTGIAFAQTTSTGTTDTSVTTPAATTGATTDTSATGAMTTTGAATTPGAPNTGTGGNATANVLMLTASALAVLAGSTYLLRSRATH